MVPKPFRSLRNQQITNPKNIRHSTGAGPTRQPAARDRDQTADPRHPDERLQRRKRPGPTTTPHYARGDDEARALLREAFTLSGDLQITGNTLHVRLDPASAP